MRDNRDISNHSRMIENQIRILSSEILRLAKLPYTSWKNKEQIRSLDAQIAYLEEVMAAFERDFKKSI